MNKIGFFLHIFEFLDKEYFCSRYWIGLLFQSMKKKCEKNNTDTKIYVICLKRIFIRRIFIALHLEVYDKE